MRNIRRNAVSFLSIVIISMLAATAYLGLSFSAEAVRKSADATYETERAADIEISATVPFTEKDLEAVRAAEGVTDAEGIVYLYSRVSSGNETKDIAIRSLPERIGLPHVLDGRLPQAADECMAEKTLAEKMGYRIGDEVRLTGRNVMTDAAIRVKTYTVTGLFTISDHLTEMVTFEPMILVTREAFDTRLLPEGRHTRVLVRIGTENPYRFSSGWKDSADRVRKRLEELNGKWIVTAQHQSASYVCSDADAEILSTVSVTFSMLFVVIAALVIYSTIGRMVENDSRLVGAAKAMGLKNSEVFAKYVLFGTGGTMAGAAAGVLAAYFVFQRIILYCFGSVFLFGEVKAAFLPGLVVLVTVLFAALSVAAVSIACRRLMKSTAVSLMSGQNAGGSGGKNASGKKRSSGGRSRALYVRLMLRNMRTDWKRVLVSTVSIAGCCMLLMIGFSLKFAVSRVPERQYDGIQNYDMEIRLDLSAHPDAMEGISTALDEHNLAHTGAYTAEMPYEANGEQGILTLICPEDGEVFPDYYHLADAKTGRALGIPERGALVTHRFAEQYGLAAGDRFLLYDQGMGTHEAEIAGVFKNYIGIVAVCGRAYAEECLGGETPGNTVLLRSGGKDPEALRGRLSETEGFVSLASSRKEEAMLNGVSLMLNLVILLLSVLAVMIACFILLNLVSTYVNQKKNELTIMRINGYTTGETMRYASMECYGITALGILLGLAGGQAFSVFLIRRIDQMAISFVKEPLWVSFAVSAAITAVISGTIHYFAFRKIRNLKLSDIQR